VIILNQEGFTSLDKLKLTPSNRGFFYADGFFETIRLYHNSIPLWNLHLARIIETLKFLSLDINVDFESLYQNLIQLAQINHVTDGKIKIVFYRESFGAYIPSDNKTFYLVTIEPITSSFDLNEKPPIFKNFIIYPSNFTKYKTLNKTEWTQAGIWCKQYKHHSCVLINSNGRIADSLYANLFLIKNNVIYTPSLEEGALDGVCRKAVLNTAKKYGIEIFEEKLSIEDYLKNEVFFTNALRFFIECNKIESDVFYRLKNFFAKEYLTKN
jgi:branched-chain amino acid aminotransferase